MKDTPRSFMREQDRSHPSAWEVDFRDITDSRYQQSRGDTMIMIMKKTCGDLVGASSSLLRNS